MRGDVDVFDAVEIGPLAHDLVDELRRVVELGPAHDRQPHPVDRHAALPERPGEAVDAPAVLLAPLRRAEIDALARGGANVVALVVADHDDGDVHGIAPGLLGLDLVVELEARDARERAALLLQLHAQVTREAVDEAAQEPLAKGIAVDLHAIDIAGRERRDVAGAGDLLRQRAVPRQEGERRQRRERDEKGTQALFKAHRQGQHSSARPRTWRRPPALATRPLASVLAVCQHALLRRPRQGQQ